MGSQRGMITTDEEGIPILSRAEERLKGKAMTRQPWEKKGGKCVAPVLCLIQPRKVTSSAKDACKLPPGVGAVPWCLKINNSPQP